MNMTTLLNHKEVCAKTSLSKSTILKLEKEGKFPKRIALSARKVVWRTSHIEEWIDNREAANEKALAPILQRQA